MSTRTVDKAVIQVDAAGSAGCYHAVSNRYVPRSWLWSTDWALAYFTTKEDSLI